jgi:hypothetical protein
MLSSREKSTPAGGTRCTPPSSLQAGGRHQEYVFEVPDDRDVRQRVHAWLQTLFR